MPPPRKRLYSRVRRGRSQQLGIWLLLGHVLAQRWCECLTSVCPVGAYDSIPDYADPELKMGAMVRSACWLATEVGEGGAFTKAQLRQAVPGREQVDRRMRDLRKFGWRIDEYRMGKNLKPDELRLVKIGVPVWDKAARKAATPPTISAKVRQEVFTRDDHACVRCGAAAGEYFNDQPGVRVRLTAAHVYPDTMGGKATAADLVTACQRCNEAIREETPNYLDEQQVLARMRSLGRLDRARLLQRIQTRRRESDKVDDVWRAYLQLPGVGRSVVEEALADLLRS